MAKDGDRQEEPTGVKSAESDVPQRLIDAAVRLIRSGGVQSVTVQALIAEADVYPDAVRYHFGGKAGLIAAVIESLANDETLRSIAETSAGRSPSEQIHRLVESDHQLLDDLDSFRDFYAILPAVVVDEELRQRVAKAYTEYREIYAAGLGSQSHLEQTRLKALSVLMLAAIDGLAVQRLLDPDCCSLPTVLALLEEMMTTIIGVSSNGE